MVVVGPLALGRSSAHNASNIGFSDVAFARVPDDDNKNDGRELGQQLLLLSLFATPTALSARTSNSSVSCCIIGWSGFCCRQRLCELSGMPFDRLSRAVRVCVGAETIAQAQR